MRSDEEIEAMCSKRGDGHHTHADAHSPHFDGPVHSHPGYPTHDHAAIDTYMNSEDNGYPKETNE